MTAYYNEIDPYAAQWLRNLIKEGLIADGEVDTRSIVDVRPDDLTGFEQCHFFAGLGGWSGALRLAGVPDTEPLWTGSCPCQPFSLAGKQKGFDDDRHLWPVWRELIRERRPAKVFGEQVASASQWLGLVRGDLEAMGYAVGAIPVEAASAGADHLRDRYWFVGHAIGQGQLQQEGTEPDERRWTGDAGYRSNTVANSDSGAIRYEPGRRSGPRGAGSGEHSDDSEIRLADSEVERRSHRYGGSVQGADVGEWSAQQPQRCSGDAGVEWVVGADGKARRVKSGIRLLAHGIPARVAKLRALGNAIDLRPAAQFIGAAMSTLSQGEREHE